MLSDPLLGAERPTRALLRTLIAAEADALRRETSIVRQLQRDAAPEASKRQSRLARLRHHARARQVLYGLARGRSWAQMERSHPDGDPTLLYALDHAWREARVAVVASVGERPLVPPGLLPYVDESPNPWSTSGRLP